MKLLLRRKRFSQPALTDNSSSLLSLMVAYICFSIALIILRDALSWRARLLITNSHMFISGSSLAFFLYGIVIVSNVERAKTHLHKRRSLSRVNYSVSRAQISTAARTSLIFAHIFSNRVKQRQVRASRKQQPHAQQGCAAALCALSLSELARGGVLLTQSRLLTF